MKKLILIMMALALVLGLSACAGSEARAVDKAIEALPEEISPADEAEVKDARQSYKALTADEKKHIKKLDKLAEAELQLEILQIEQAIDDLPHAIATAGEKVADIKERYDDLPEERKADVDNYGKFEKSYGKWCSEIWYKAEKFFDKGQLPEAYEHYKMLPDDYESSKERISEIKPKLARAKERSELFGTWVWDGVEFEDVDGSILSADYQSLMISESQLYSVYTDTFGVELVGEAVEAGKNEPFCLNMLPDVSKEVCSGTVFISESLLESVFFDDLKAKKDNKYLLTNAWIIADKSVVITAEIALRFTTDSRLCMEYQINAINSRGQSGRFEGRFFYDKLA